MKRVYFMIVFYCIVHGAAGDFAVKYEGMDRKTVTQLIKQTHNAPFNFVDQSTYKVFVAQRQPKPSGRTPSSNIQH